MPPRKKIAIQNMCRHCDYKWPKNLCSGVAFYQGYKITIKEFNNYARLFV